MGMQFFSSVGGGGGAVPFRRTIEPKQIAATIEADQIESLRLARCEEGWRFYFGNQWAFARPGGDPLVTINYFRKAIDKSVSFLVAKGFAIKVPDAVEQVTKPLLDEVWKNNDRQVFAYEMATMGGVTGDAFIMVTGERPTPMQLRINPYSRGKVRVNLLGSEQVFPTWDPADMQTLVSVRIETLYYGADQQRAAGRMAGHHTLDLKRFTQVITPEYIIKQKHGEAPSFEVNALGEIPIVHIKNLPIPKEYYGLPDGLDLVDLQRELNEKATDISDIINYFASPITVIYGAKAKQIDRSSAKIWSGLPNESRIETLKLEGDLDASVSYWERIKKSFHEVSDVPEGSLGSMQPISNTSGVALHTQYQPLIEKTLKKAATYEAGLTKVNYFILRVAMLQGLVYLPFDCCASCGGRIIEVEDPTRTVTRWDSEKGAYVELPYRERRCYEVDKQTLNFQSPENMRLKFWKQYGFGRELREMRFKEIQVEVQRGGRSFWDYSLLQDAVRAKYAENFLKQHPELVQQAALADAATEEGQEGATAAAMSGNMHQPGAQIPYPVWMEAPAPIPPDDLEVPEEPERVKQVIRQVNPETGEFVGEQLIDQFLVPTGCKKPEFLNPFENEVTFQDFLPKDDALQAQLLTAYQQNGWVDAEWCQGQLPLLQDQLSEVRKRMKNASGRVKSEQLPMAQVQSGAGPDSMELAPMQQPAAAYPTPKGNPGKPQP